jgi:uncharacterized protein YqjF (DUF2071 family)
MLQAWRRLTFLHWRCPAPAVAGLVPAGLTVDTFDGSAWVGLVPFLMDRVRLPIGPGVPWLSRFPETNVRTYVRDGHGRPGIWFLSLDAARLPAVVAARAGYRLPYFWSDMAVTARAGRLEYRCRRRFPAGGPRCDAGVRPGRPLAEAERDELVHFLTARFRLFTVVAGRLASAVAEHPPWPLHHGEVLALDQDVVAAGGLPAPSGAPLVHTSPGVEVRIGRWQWVDSDRSVPEFA